MGTRVLVVDDDCYVLETLGAMLREDGFDPVTCSSATAALAAFESSPSFALVLCDYWMPELNGVELAERIRALDPTVPVIMMTGEVGRLPEIFEHGVVPLVKPFSIKLLRRVLDDLASKPIPGPAVNRVRGRSYH